MPGLSQLGLQRQFMSWPILPPKIKVVLLSEVPFSALVPLVCNIGFLPAQQFIRPRNCHSHAKGPTGEF
jgi:hypothetical protein